jgi:cysteinyl-tRNA synthetase
MRYLGESFDVHGGGEDLIFPHHECEIAQAEAATGKPFSRYWLHNGFVNFGTEKMSKSLGNTLAIREVIKRHEPDALRLWLLGTHYRHMIEFSEDRLREAGRALERFTRLFHDVQAFWSGSAEAPVLPADLQSFGERFEAAMDDDFNTPQALGALFDLSRALYERLEQAPTLPAARQALVAGVSELQRLGGALGLFQQAGTPAGPPAEIERLVAERTEARRQRNWRRSDELREEIHRLGWQVEDTPAGPRLARRPT